MSNNNCIRVRALLEKLQHVVTQSKVRETILSEMYECGCIACRNYLALQASELLEKLYEYI